ncbi:hypothetical protein TDB9533_03137 [Thalassocella blandensis]|nr:hypothetical protein TDB9533_03137 [Thalassocella blandensis]
MKLRNIDLSSSPVNLEHQALALPPIEKQPLHPVLQASVVAVCIILSVFVVAGMTNIFWPSFDAGIKTVSDVISSPVFWTAMAIGLLAQTVDGALGMAYGITSTSFLLASGIPPALATASVHMAEVFTTGVSGVAHAKLGNVNRQLFLRLLLPGILGVITGALVVTTLDASILKPIISGYLLLMGVYILCKAFKKIQSSHNALPRHIAKLAFIGGFVDTSGGGGWGPVVTTTLLGSGHDPRTTIGSVNFAEFFLTLISATSLFILVEESIWPVVTGLMLGGLLAAPFAALACKHIPAKTLLIVVGLLISAISVFSLTRLFW